ncbi:MAG: hypothetical protein R2774_10850 [Saprospiraceae bacterium]
MKPYLITILGTVALMKLWSGCAVTPEYSDTPNIEFRSFSKDTLLQGSLFNDSTYLTIFFTDGDGDFGIAATSNGSNIYLTDTRTGEIFRSFKAPLIPEVGSANGVSGTIKLKLYTTCCIYLPDTGLIPCEPNPSETDSVVLEMYIKDRAGHQSNTITLPPFILRCE